MYVKEVDVTVIKREEPPIHPIPLVVSGLALPLPGQIRGTPMICRSPKAAKSPVRRKLMTKLAPPAKVTRGAGASPATVALQRVRVQGPKQ
uniref:Uncharacterized protein n=1 Tax=Oryza brachyantha TaxID=4533 RepID=J3L433_ORYBR